jgi:hypothetical protein
MDDSQPLCLRLVFLLFNGAAASEDEKHTKKKKILMVDPPLSLAPPPTCKFHCKAGERLFEIECIFEF